MHVKHDCQLQDCLTNMLNFTHYFLQTFFFFQKFQMNYKKGYGFTIVSLLAVLYVG